MWVRCMRCRSNLAATRPAPTSPRWGSIGLVLLVLLRMGSSSGPRTTVKMYSEKKDEQVLYVR